MRIEGSERRNFRKEDRRSGFKVLYVRVALLFGLWYGRGGDEFIDYRISKIERSELGGLGA